MRAAASMLMNFVLALVFLHAPFLHVHEHEVNEHHPHDGFFHIRTPHHQLTFSMTAQVEDFDPDDDASYQDWLSVAAGDYSVAMFLAPVAFNFRPALSSEPHSEPIILSGHDPPEFAGLFLRGPPA